VRAREIKIVGGVGYVPLTQGLTALVDAADVPLIADRNWCATRGHKTFYATREFYREDGTRTTITMHQFLAGENVDHRDRNGLNNRRGNLRKASAEKQIQNQSLRVCNKSGYRGVSFDSTRKKWIAQIGDPKRHTYRFLGRFSSAEAAARRYDEAAKERFGEFANPNFPEEARA